MEKLKVAIVIEILGKPVEHVSEAINLIVTKIGNEKGVKIINKTLHPPVPVKDSKDLFTTFAEIGLELDSLSNYFSIIFSYMPSHIEIVNPEEIQMSNYELNDLANTLAQRLHGYDAIAKQLMGERELLLKKLQEVAPHLFKKQEEIAVKEENKKSKIKKPKKGKKK